VRCVSYVTYVTYVALRVVAVNDNLRSPVCTAWALSPLVVWIAGCSWQTRPYCDAPMVGSNSAQRLWLIILACCLSRRSPTRRCHYIHRSILRLIWPDVPCRQLHLYIMRRRGKRWVHWCVSNARVCLIPSQTASDLPMCVLRHVLDRHTRLGGSSDLRLQLYPEKALRAQDLAGMC
jgi:hypothetical protein